MPRRVRGWRLYLVIGFRIGMVSISGNRGRVYMRSWTIGENYARRDSWFEQESSFGGYRNPCDDVVVTYFGVILIYSPTLYYTYLVFRDSK